MTNLEIQTSLEIIATYEDAIEGLNYWAERKAEEYASADTNHRRYLTRNANKALVKIEEYKELIEAEKALIEAMEPTVKAVEAETSDIVLALNSVEKLEESQARNILIQDLKIAIISGMTEDELVSKMEEIIKLKYS
mgnify:CR=1 FL=1